MEKILKYKTLKGLIEKQQQFSFNTFLSGRMCHKKMGWCKFKVTPELKKEIEDKFKAVVGDLNFNKNNSSLGCGLFDRLIITNRLTGQYIGGQDYPSELRYLKTLIKRG